MDQPALNTNFASGKQNQPSVPQVAKTPDSGQFFKILIISAIIIFLFIAFFDFFLVNKKTKHKNADATSLSVDKKEVSPTPSPIIKSSFNGKVKSIDIENKTLVVEKADGKSFNASLVANGVVSAGIKKITFAEIKVGDAVSLYSKNDMPGEGKIYHADLLGIFKPE